jgi:RNA polymerase-associated protein RTF1
MLARKSQLQGNKSAGMLTLERSRLTQARTLAQRRHDFKEVAEIDTQLTELAAASSADRPNGSLNEHDMLTKVNERNRRANMEAVRKAETAEADRKRRERKLAATAGGTIAPIDPSARLKTVPRLFNSATPTRLVVPCFISSSSY